MAIYKTYQEAVIANGIVNGVFTDGKRFYTDGTELKYFNIKPCNPVDYLETLEDFLARGLRLVNGDKYTGRDGNVVNVKTYNLSTVNTPWFGDEKRYVVKSAAYDTETPEEKEAFDAMPNQATIDAMNDKPCDEVYDNANDAFSACVNGDGDLIEHDTPEGKEEFDAMTDTAPQQFDWRNGDHCIFGAGNRSGIYVTYDAYNEGHVIYSGGEYHYVLDGDFRKPETPEQRKERESMERKAEIERMLSTSIKFNNTDLPKTIARIIDDAGYRKQ